MSNNEMINVPRELLSTYLGGTDGDWVEAGHELRSLLAKPPAQLQGEPVAWEMDDTAGATGEIVVTNSRAVRDEWIRSELPVCPLYSHPAEQSAQIAEKLVKRLAEEFPVSDTMLTVECVADLLTEYLTGQ